MESLLGLCSGQFTGREPTNDTNGVAEEESPSTQAVRELLGVSQPKQSSSLVGMFGKEIEDIEEADVLGLCSGRFPSQAAIEMSEDEDMPILRKKASHNMLAKAKVTKELVQTLLVSNLLSMIYLFILPGSVSPSLLIMKLSCLEVTLTQTQRTIKAVGWMSMR